MSGNRRISPVKVAKLVFMLLGILAAIVAATAVTVKLIINAVKKPGRGEPARGTSVVSVSSNGKSSKYDEYADTRYAVDVAEYLDAIEPESDEYLTLVSPASPLSGDYVPDDLVDCGFTRDDGRDTQQLREKAAKALAAWMAESDALGKRNGIAVTSGYRSYASQKSLFNWYCDQYQNKFATRAEVEEYVSTFSNPPGASEHQTGLCMDISNLSFSSDEFAGTPEAEWLAESCWKFGFILRYPKEKTEITGIQYEPWHFRYVGRYHAMKMRETGQCLEEYVKTLAESGAK